MATAGQEGALAGPVSGQTEVLTPRAVTPSVVSETLLDWMEGHIAAAAHRPACIGPHGTTSFQSLHADARALASHFRTIGVRRGDVVAVQLPNGIEFLLSYLAAGYIGAVLQTVHMPYRAAEIVPLLQHSGAKVLICLSQAKEFSPAELALSLRDRLPDLRTIMAVGANAPAGAAPFDVYRQMPADRLDDRPAAGDDFLLLYTSGTTAAPKGVPVPYSKFLSNAWHSAPELGIDGSSVLLSAAPFTHLYGLFSINLALSQGCATAVLPAFAPSALAEAIAAHRPTGLFVAPAHVAACLQAGLFTADGLASLRFVLISGSVCPPELARTLQDLMPNGKVCQLWGMSELQAGTFTRPDDPEEVRLRTAGRATPGTELRIMDGATAGRPNVEGELQIRGLSVFNGYLGNPQATADAFTQDGWFRTGDLAVMDEHGNIRITGRMKEVINRGGVKFNPADVEAAIGLHPAVASCAIVPMPDPVLGERACCFIVKAPGASIDLDAIRAWLAGRDIAKNKWPERVEFIAEMPMTPTRKIKKAELAKLVVDAQ